MKFSYLLTAYGFIPFTTYLTMLHKTMFGGIMLLVVYVDDVILLSGNEASISTIKAYLHEHFVIADF